MRSRLLAATLAAVAVAVIVLGVPLAAAVRTLLVQRELDQLQREVELTATVLNRSSITSSQQRDLLTQIGLRTGSQLLLIDSNSRTVLRTPTPPAVPDSFNADLARALTGEVGREVSEGLVGVSVPVNIGDVNQILRAVHPDDDLQAAIRAELLQVAAIAVAALAGAAALATWQGGRLSAPLEELAVSARRLGHGDFTVRAPRSGMPEADDVADALDSTAARLGVLVERSRSFGADASHQLRTPLTALRLDLEALEVTGADPEVLAAAFVEADRLEATIAELLALAEPPAGEEVIDVATVVEERLGPCRAIAKTQGRRVVLDVRPAPPVRARAAALGQALQVLLDNALVHGAGTITVSVRPVAGGARLCVADEGTGLAELPTPSPGSGGGGRGLPLARSLIEAEGGRLRCEPSPAGALLCLLLPMAEPVAEPMAEPMAEPVAEPMAEPAEPVRQTGGAAVSQTPEGARDPASTTPA